MMKILRGLSMAGALLWLGASPACKREPEPSARPADNTVREDVKDLGKSTAKAAKDIGHAAVETADKAGQGLAEAANEVGADSRDAWITTKVKSELASHGFDPLGVHVDTEAKVVTLSGTVDSAAAREQAVALARAVKDVAGVTDHLFVEPAKKK
jgi:hyperosmotically inducible protein